jgi:hypothetical protein
MAWNWGMLAGHQLQPKKLRSALQANLAIEQEKRMWDVSSGAPQSAHAPDARPFLPATKRLEGSLSRISSQAKILIFNGTLASHTSVWKATDAPCDSL